ncbi:MAG: aminotransferase class V-fold PLP-dependent enzyme [Chloroflexota bacterium]
MKRTDCCDFDDFLKAMADENRQHILVLLQDGEMNASELGAHFDYVVLSAHKMYAPYGTGALIGRRDTFEVGEPDLRGGGQVDLVTEDSVVWSAPPEREEAGSPNVVGAVALAATIQQLEALGMDVVAAHEAELTAYALQRLSQIDGLQLYGDADPLRAGERLGVIPFNLKVKSHFLVAAILGYEFGVGVRNGCFCAHPYILRRLEQNHKQGSSHLGDERHPSDTGLFAYNSMYVELPGDAACGGYIMPDFLELTVDKFTFKIATDRFYSPEGMWAREEDGRVRVGLSDFFQQHNGDVAFAEITEEGTELAVGDEIAVIETIKVDISLPSPLAGEIVEVNPAMEMEPEKINFDPYGDGWLALVEPQEWKTRRESLLSPEAYYEQVKVEAEEELRKG